MPPPRIPPIEREFPQPFLQKRWIVWDPIPDYLELKPEILNKIFLITLQTEKQHLAVEQQKLDMVMELFK